MSLPLGKSRGTLVEKRCDKPLYKITSFCKMLKMYIAQYLS